MAKRTLRYALILSQALGVAVLGPPDGSRPREVLISLERLDALMKGGDLLEDAPER